MTTTTITYTIETIDQPFSEWEGVPWGMAHRHAWGLSERRAIRLYNVLQDWYHPQGPRGGYSGHVRIVGSDDWTYEVEAPTPGERSTLKRLYHLGDS